MGLHVKRNTCVPFFCAFACVRTKLRTKSSLSLSLLSAHKELLYHFLSFSFGFQARSRQHFCVSPTQKTRTHSEMRTFESSILSLSLSLANKARRSERSVIIGPEVYYSLKRKVDPTILLAPSSRKKKTHQNCNCVPCSMATTVV